MDLRGRRQLLRLMLQSGHSFGQCLHLVVPQSRRVAHLREHADLCHSALPYCVGEIAISMVVREGDKLMAQENEKDGPDELTAETQVAKIFEWRRGFNAMHLGVADRVHLIEGDVATAVEKGSADAVVMIEVLHEIAPEFRQEVVTACHEALAVDGWLMIIDESYPSTLDESRKAEFLFPVQTGFEELTWGNVVPTRDEQETLLSSAGFKGEIGRSIVGEGFTVLTAQKQA